MSSFTRAHLIISGRVQGVFFRVETQYAAQNLGVNGWVRNLPDGTVEALFEGAADAVEAMIEWCRKGPPRSRVDDVNIHWEAYQGDKLDFSIR
jgi:acylphosphatase